MMRYELRLREANEATTYLEVLTDVPYLYDPLDRRLLINDLQGQASVGLFWLERHVIWLKITLTKAPLYDWDTVAANVTHVVQQFFEPRNTNLPEEVPLLELRHPLAS